METPRNGTAHTAVDTEDKGVTKANLTVIMALAEMNPLYVGPERTASILEDGIANLYLIAERTDDFGIFLREVSALETIASAEGRLEEVNSAVPDAQEVFIETQTYLAGAFANAGDVRTSIEYLNNALRGIGVRTDKRPAVLFELAERFIVSRLSEKYPAFASWADVLLYADRGDPAATNTSIHNTISVLERDGILSPSEVHSPAASDCSLLRRKNLGMRSQLSYHQVRAYQNAIRNEVRTAMTVGQEGQFAPHYTERIRTHWQNARILAHGLASYLVSQTNNPEDFQNIRKFVSREIDPTFFFLLHPISADRGKETDAKGAIHYDMATISDISFGIGMSPKERRWVNRIEKYNN